jgi:hypothetical protein
MEQPILARASQAAETPLTAARRLSQERATADRRRITEVSADRPLPAARATTYENDGFSQ